MDPKERFYRHFESQATSLQEDIANLGDISASGGERKDATDSVLGSIARLTSEVSDASEYAPPRDQMIYGQALKALREQLNIQTRSLGPKSLFEFSTESKHAFISANTNRSAAAAAADTAAAAAQADTPDATPGSPPDLPTTTRDYNAEMSSQTGPTIRKPSFTRSRGVDIAGQSAMHIILPPTARRATSSCSVAGLRGCVLDMSSTTGTTEVGSTSTSTSTSAGGHPFASLVIRDVQRSLVIAGRVAGAAHVTGVRNSVLVLNARQVRMHECVDVTVYLWCGSHPIIEGCRGMRFAPLPGNYLVEGQEEEADGGGGGNQWDQVDDFNWLKAEASPNWERLSGEESSVLPGEFWTETVRGGPSLSTEDILRRAGI